MKELTVPAETRNLDAVADFVTAELDEYGCTDDIKMQVMIAVEEIFVNIAHYAYDSAVGEATVRCEVSSEPLQVSIQFLDGGTPYNPLERETPDVTLPLDKRKIGGLGVYIVRKQMDNVEYEYAAGKNVLTIHKRFTAQ